MCLRSQEWKYLSGLGLDCTNRLLSLKKKLLVFTFLTDKIYDSYYFKPKPLLLCSFLIHPTETPPESLSGIRVWGHDMGHLKFWSEKRKTCNTCIYICLGMMKQWRHSLRPLIFRDTRKPLDAVWGRAQRLKHVTWIIAIPSLLFIVGTNWAKILFIFFHTEC